MSSRLMERRTKSQRKDAIDSPDESPQVPVQMVFTRRGKRTKEGKKSKENDSKENDSKGSKSGKKASIQKVGNQNNANKSTALVIIPSNLITTRAPSCSVQQTFPEEQSVGVQVKNHSVSPSILENEITPPDPLQIVVQESSVMPSTSSSPIDVVGTTNLNLSNPTNITERSGMTKKIRMSELQGDARVQAREKEKLRKRKQREAQRGIRSGRDREGSVNIVPKIPISVTQGEPVGPSLNLARRTLSLLVHDMIPAHTYATNMCSSQHEDVYKTFVSKFDDGKSIKWEWVKTRVIQMMRTNRKTARGLAKKQLELQESNVLLSPLKKLKDEEFDFFAKQLTSESFKEESAKKSKMSKDMVAKHGCGNPMGYGGLPSQVAQHIAKEGVLPNMAQKVHWKSTAREKYIESRERSVTNSVEAHQEG